MGQINSAQAAKTKLDGLCWIVEKEGRNSELVSSVSHGTKWILSFSTGSTHCSVFYSRHECATLSFSFPIIKPSQMQLPPRLFGPSARKWSACDGEGGCSVHAPAWIALPSTSGLGYSYCTAWNGMEMGLLASGRQLLPSRLRRLIVASAEELPFGIGLIDTNMFNN